MEDLRSKSCNDPRSMGVENNGNNYNSLDVNSNGELAPHYKASLASDPGGVQDLRCYNASYASSSAHNNNGQLDIVVAGGGGDQWEFKKDKSKNGVAFKSWSFSDPELKRKTRVASYKAYTVEGKVKGSVKKSFRWVKERYSQMIHGYR